MCGEDHEKNNHITAIPQFNMINTTLIAFLARHEILTSGV